jgi:hypothetical protein
MFAAGYVQGQARISQPGQALNQFLVIVAKNPRVPHNVSRPIKPSRHAETLVATFG